MNRPQRNESEEFMLQTNLRKVLTLPAPIRNRGESLLHQQCWCWGKDVRSQSGNRLLEYGFAKKTCPQGHQGSSCYTCYPDPDLQISLWGFGFLVCEKELGSMFLGRFDFRPRWASARHAPADIHVLDDLAYLAYPETRHSWICATCLMIRGLQWISSYESWIRKNHGVGRREDSLAGFQKLAAPGDEMVECWKGLVTDCELFFSDQLSRLYATSDRTHKGERQ